ncbi:MAG: hypothetical protein M4579_001167 [Chaenotheca gracillima]|nr:MAG: hypothetical protein M4579_001167 [Chaenotheca gracillima]
MSYPQSSQSSAAQFATPSSFYAQTQHGADPRSHSSHHPQSQAQQPQHQSYSSSQPQSFRAPLSSPTATYHSNQYFTSAPPPPATSLQPQPSFSNVPSHPHARTLPQRSPVSMAQDATMTSDQHHPAGSDPRRTDDASATAPFIRDLNLVSEAAKRAQMAVLMRDLDGVAL